TLGVGTRARYGTLVGDSRGARGRVNRSTHSGRFILAENAAVRTRDLSRNPGTVRECSENPRVQEPDETSGTCRTVRKVHERRAALFERKPLRLRGAEHAREQRPEHGLVADERHRRVTWMSRQRREDPVETSAGKRRLDLGLHAPEGPRGDLGGRVRT